MFEVVRTMRISDPKYGTRTITIKEYEGSKESCEKFIIANNEKFGGKLELRLYCI